MYNGINKPIVFSRLAKKYQKSVFYERELKLWNENPTYDGLPLRVWLYHNRLEYLGKSPKELSEAEILRGFTISGVLKGYTSFDTSLMHQVVQKYGIQSVYDPCAGWGERMLYCFHNNICYLGVDINDKLRPGYEQMIQDFNMMKQSVAWGDSAVYSISGQFDAVITCPPYGSIEIYSDKGAENLSHSKFISWWKNVVKNSLNVDPKYFCLQINRKYHDEMVGAVVETGFEVIDELFYKSNRSSHMTRKGGQNIKQEYESMIVAQRVISI